MKRLVFGCLFLLVAASFGRSQSPDESKNLPGPKHDPIRVIKIDKTRFSYYGTPEAVAASTTFYISGSEGTSVVFDFVGFTASFYNAGKQLRQPSFVQINLVASTYRDGCKYKDKYANPDNHKLHVSIFADNQSLISTDLPLPPTSIRQTRHGNLCTEVYQFEIPYEQFVQLTGARNAAVTLGTREFEIKKDHLSSLRVMKDGVGRY